MRLVNNAEDFLKYTSRPTHITYKNFGKDYAASHVLSAIQLTNLCWVYCSRIMQMVDV